MLRTKIFSLKKASLVNFFCSTNLVRSDKSNPPSKTWNLSKKKTINDGPKSKASGSDKKLYTNIYDDKERTKAKEKLKDLISDMEKTKAINKEKEVKVTQAITRKKFDEKKKSEPSKFNLKKNFIESAEEVAGKFGENTEIKLDLMKSLLLLGTSKGKQEKVQPLPNRSPITETLTKEDISVKMEHLKIKSGRNINMSGDKKRNNALGIFTKLHQQKESPPEEQFMIWQKLDEEDLKFLAACPPKNYFEELIMWTEQGKLWHFPINNHQGMEEEAQTDFTEHIFLEEYLEPWCPKTGPLRHFMEVVLVGLSKNSALTVQDKKEHIYWFRDYFESKKKLLKDMGAFASTKEIGDGKEKEF